MCVCVGGGGEGEGEGGLLIGYADLFIFVMQW